MTNTLPGMAKVIRKPLSYWHKLFDDQLIADTFAEHGRCPECGWFAGHCSHTAVLGSDGQYKRQQGDSRDSRL